MKKFLTLLFFVSISSFGQTSKNLTDQITLVNGDRFKGVIFSSDYEVPMLDETLRGRFTPTLEQITKLEKDLRSVIKDINKNRSGQRRSYGPVVDRNLGKYTRQYLGFINENGDKIIYVGFHWHSRDYNWKKDFVMVFDGGSYHWTIRYNVDKGEFFHFGVNGVALIPSGSKYCAR